MDFPLISIIIPVYKVELYLERCLNSVINQTYLNIEIILVNDGSPDRCGSICDSYAEKDKRIVTIHKKNGGLSDARNVGLDAANGEFITFIDSDDFVHDKYIEGLYKVAYQGDCDIVQCKFYKGEKSEFTNKILINDLNFYISSATEALLDKNYKVTAWAKLYKKDVIGKVRFPVGYINEDVATYYQFVYNSKVIGIINEELYYYYQSSTSIMRGNNNCNYDFIEIYNDSIAFFNMRNEKLLAMKMRERFCVCLMVKYIQYYKFDKSVNDLHEMFIQNYQQITEKKLVSLIGRIAFTIFSYIPKSFARMLNIKNDLLRSI